VASRSAAMSDQPDRRPGHPLYRPDEDESLAAMPEQADTREAGSREVQSPATEGGASPLDQPVTGSASRSVYQQEVAEAIRAEVQVTTEEEAFDAIAAVLASEGVVDPEVVYMLDKVRAERDKAEAKVERLEAQKERHLDLVPMAKAAGMEQAAKKLELMARDAQPAHDIVLLNKAAAVIRERNITLDAEIEKLMAQLKEM
ncbi:MAG: hypothetical protein QQN63_06245, partial [Nitrosopumilus sp.]